MAATVAAVSGARSPGRLKARALEVQLRLSSGLPRITIVGLPDNAVRETRERMRPALTAIGLALLPRVIIINLSRQLPKEGSHCDILIWLGPRFGLTLTTRVTFRKSSSEVAACATSR